MPDARQCRSVLHDELPTSPDQDWIRRIRLQTGISQDSSRCGSGLRPVVSTLRQIPGCRDFPCAAASVHPPVSAPVTLQESLARSPEGSPPRPDRVGFRRAATAHQKAVIFVCGNVLWHLLRNSHSRASQTVAAHAFQQTLPVHLVPAKHECDRPDRYMQGHQKQGFFQLIHSARHVGKGEAGTQRVDAVTGSDLPQPDTRQLF